MTAALEGLRHGPAGSALLRAASRASTSRTWKGPTRSPPWCASPTDGRTASCTGLSPSAASTGRSTTSSPSARRWRAATRACVNEELERPDLILIDGGKGQLSAARGILDGPRAGSHSRDRPGQEAGGDLHPGPRRAAGPRRGIDRACGSWRPCATSRHRFATKLNKKRRTKKLSMQVLEGVPGIGGARSRRLMEAFGSVEAILGPSLEDLQKKRGPP